jgi:ABC-2 type transport system permease protein
MMNVIRPTLAVMRRELGAFFRTPLGWVVIALFACLSGVFFVGRAITPGAPASLREFFGVWWGLLLIIAPAISMRLFSEELRSGTIETTLAAPISDGQLVVGKYLASVAFLLLMLLPSVALVVVLSVLSRPDFGPVVAGYLGLVLLGALYLAVGCVASALTSSQTLAFLGTLFVLLMLDVVAARLASTVPERMSPLLLALSPAVQVTDFHRGLIDSGRIVYFFAASAWFLAMATVVLQSRRWR